MRGHHERMRISAHVRSSEGRHTAEVGTDGVTRTMDVPAREALPGSAVSGGELLFLALATCYGNDVFREAAREGVAVDDVEVTVDGSFDGPGDPGRDLEYRVRVVSPEPAERIRDLLARVDGIAEIHATVRRGTPIRLADVDIAPS